MATRHVSMFPTVSPLIVPPEGETYLSSAFRRSMELAHRPCRLARRGAGGRSKLPAASRVSCCPNLGFPRRRLRFVDVVGCGFVEGMCSGFRATVLALESLVLRIGLRIGFAATKLNHAATSTQMLHILPSPSKGYSGCMSMLRSVGGSAALLFLSTGRVSTDGSPQSRSRSSLKASSIVCNTEGKLPEVSISSSHYLRL